ncbi:MAG: metallophosphatase family protein [Thermoflexales bacterium]|nr:metallophosphatase family protein [Thermoflexales bacterium]
MKIAILADIHGNYPALCAAVEHLERWAPDLVIVAGDTVNRGPSSAACWGFVRQRQREQGWQVILGNHEEYVISQGAPDAPREGPKFELARVSYWTYGQLGAEAVKELQALPFSLEVRRNGRIAWPVRVAHGSMLGTRDGIYPFTPDSEMHQKSGTPPPVVFCVGHTHQPLVRDLGGLLVVNAGSVGMPFDGDARLCYAQVSWHHGAWHAALVRLPYDRAQAEQDFYRTGFIDEAGALARLVLREFQIARGQIYGWAQEYEEAVLNGAISIEAAVQRYLETV